MQEILFGIESIKDVLIKESVNKFFLVCGGSFYSSAIKKKIDALSIPYESFSGFTANPLYEDVLKGIECYKASSCSTIIAIGGGSAIDVAKCIKYLKNIDTAIHYSKQSFNIDNDLLIAVPTTAGTGSESTRFAVIYDEGQKQSIVSYDIVPNYAVLDAKTLVTLPVYQKKCTFLDALCQAIESYWCVNSNSESKEFAKKAIQLLVKNRKAYLNEDESSYNEIMLGSNLAGRAINITQTTAAHAMSYKLTSLFNLPHGHAVAICLPKIWRYMCDNLVSASDSRGSEYLSACFNEIAGFMGFDSVENAINCFEEILLEMEIFSPKNVSQSNLEELVSSVNSTRLKNNPVLLSVDALNNIYHQILFEH